MNIIDILTNSGYEFHSMGSDVLPGTLLKDTQPIGFLMPDLTVSLIPAHENEKAGIEKAVNFAVEYQGLSEIEGEYILTQYDKTLLTVGYAYDEKQPVFKVYSIIDDDTRTIIDSYDTKDAATHAYAELSGLIPGDAEHTLVRDRDSSRISRFVENLKSAGYKLKDSDDKQYHAYEITNSNDDLIGYISNSNKLVLATDNGKLRESVSQLYRDTAPNVVELPSFFEKLKSLLKEIGLILKLHFTPNGKHYAIHDSQSEIATISDDQKITFTPLAKAEQMEKVNRIIDGIKLEQQQKKQTATIDYKSVQTVEAYDHVYTHQEVQELINKALIENGVSVDLPNSVAEKSVSTQQNKLSEADKALLNSFERDYEILQTLDGFNQDQYTALENQMKSTYGTADPVKFFDFLGKGENQTLSGKLSKAGEKAMVTNNLENQKKEPTLSSTKEL